MKRKDKKMAGLGTLGVILSYWVFSDSIPVKQVFNPDGSPKLSSEGVELWGRNRPLELILDIPGYALLIVSLFLIVKALYRTWRQTLKSPSATDRPNEA
jgi:hypothetical protein